ncbi:hypothetical protein ACWD7T_27735 [Streptomyces sp. 900116325]
MTKLLSRSAFGALVSAALMYPTRATVQEAPMSRLQHTEALLLAERCRRAAS